MKQTGAILKAWLQRVIATGGPYDPAALFAGVYQSITEHGEDTVLADLVEGTGDVATRVALTPWGSVYKLDDGRWAVDAIPATFVPNDSTEAQIVRGSFLATAGTAGTLKAWDDLPTPANLADENSHVTIVWRLTIDPDGRFAANIVWDG